jgi:hypothetical protein
MARGWSPLRRLSAPRRVAWPAVLAVIVVLGAACGGGTKAQPGTRSAGLLRRVAAGRCAWPAAMGTGSAP